jgi:hypothetical protein
MRILRIAAAVLITYAVGLELHAGQIYQWTDQNGVIHITNRTPPKDTKVEKVIHYKEKSSVEIELDQIRKEQKRQEDLTQQKIEASRKAAVKAKKAREEAEAAQAEAQEIFQRTDDFIDRVAVKKRRNRKRYRTRVEKAVQEAKAAETRANEAIDKANQAQKHADKAAKRAEEAEEKSP